MKVFKTITETQSYRQEVITGSLELGLVPTMGALHEGHLSLVRMARKDNDVLSVSIFVNPIQFNDPEDLRDYPRDLVKDLHMLESVLTEKDFVFCPDPNEMYPEPSAKKYDFGPLEDVMEGSSRPGHFNGVGVVVERLFRILNPHRAYFGEKDFQQVAIIRRMAQIENLDLDIISCPIIRESDGLAMSSRNALLEPELRKNAGIIYQSIRSSIELASKYSVAETQKKVISLIDSKPGFEVEYIVYADEVTLQSIDGWNDFNSIRCFAAVKAGKVRLIDNIKMDLK